MNRFGRILLWTILGLSLLANAVVLGLFLRLGALRDLANGGVDVWAELPDDTRAAFRQELRANQPRFAALLADLGQARATAFRAAAARPYDRAAVEAALAQVRSASAALQTEAQLLMLKTFDEAAAKSP